MRSFSWDPRSLHKLAKRSLFDLARRIARIDQGDRTSHSCVALALPCGLVMSS